jgi:hypothetical protein
MPQDFNHRDTEAQRREDEKGNGKSTTLTLAVTVLFNSFLLCATAVNL